MCFVTLIILAEVRSHSFALSKSAQLQGDVLSCSGGGLLSRTLTLPVPDSCKPASGHLAKFSNVIIQQTSFNKFCVPSFNCNSSSCLQPVPYLTTHLHISHCWLVLSSRADGSRKAELIFYPHEDEFISTEDPFLLIHYTEMSCPIKLKIVL